MSRPSITTSACAVVFLLAAGSAVGALTPNEELGKAIFFDDDLSLHRNQACATCHAPAAGWTGPDTAINEGGAVYEGSIPGRFGDRKPPSSAYATQSPIFHFDGELWVGGNFWDGRATGYKLGNPAADQAQGPFLNPAEQALPDSACVVYRVCTATYPVSFEDVWGPGACDISWPADVEVSCLTEGATVALDPEERAASDMAYDRIALSIASYEGSVEVNPFSSKWDLSRIEDGPKLTKQERLGFALFQGKGKCRLCHLTQGTAPLLTDYTFDNLGLPKNPLNPMYASDPAFVDEGLGAYLRNSGFPEDVYLQEIGKVKVPTLRNVGLGEESGVVKAFGHNGYFKTLEGIVHFYNTRDVRPTCPGDYTEAEALAADCWPPPEVSVNVNTDELGDLGLTRDEEEAIAAFLRTLSDGFTPAAD